MFTQQPLTEPIKTPDGETDAYEIISHLLEEKSEDLRDACPADGDMYAEALGKFNEIMKYGLYIPYKG